MKEICLALFPIFGGDECWGDGSPTETRWQVTLNSGCQVGVEMKRSWDKLTREAREASHWLDRDVEGVFDVSLEGFGGGSVSGQTRGLIVSAREKTRYLLLEKYLSEHRPKRDRPAWAWKQRDNISSDWLLALPGGDLTLSNAEFTEAAATSLCLPSPSCAGRVGEPIIGNKKIDQYGAIYSRQHCQAIIGGRDTTQ